MRLASHGLGQQRLAGAWRADQQRALGQFRADLGIALRIVEEIDDLSERLLGLVLAGDVVKGDARLFLADDLGVGLAKAHGVLAAHALLQAAHQQVARAEDDAVGKHPAQQDLHQRRGLLDDLRFKGDFGMVEQALREVVVRPGAGAVDALRALHFGEEEDGAAGVVQRHFAHFAVVQHGEELVIGDLRHPRLREQRKDEGVEEHDHQQDDDRVVKQRFFRRLMFICHKCPLSWTVDAGTRAFRAGGRAGDACARIK